MTIHAQLAAMYAQRMAGNLPAVLVGDFNLKPGDGGYDLVTTGAIDPAHGRTVQVDPIKSTLKAPGHARLRLNCDDMLSNLAFKFNLRRYSTVARRWRPREASGTPALVIPCAVRTQ
jgi:endonuclease/exonuclease/phosphatase family metal-dependent hydrolase